MQHDRALGAVKCDRAIIAGEIIETIEQNLPLQQRVVSAGKAGALAALKNSSIGKIVAAMIEDWTQNQS